MLILKSTAIAFTALCGGFVVSGGIFAFLTMIGIFPRVLSVTKTTGHIYLLESMVILGGSLGNIMDIFDLRLPIGAAGLMVYGLFSGVYVGCLAVALAEVLKIIPILIKHVKLKFGLSWLITGIALGKAAGSWLQMIYFNKG